VLEEVAEEIGERAAALRGGSKSHSILEMGYHGLIVLRDVDFFFHVDAVDVCKERCKT
jgi:hypothetical protein